LSWESWSTLQRSSENYTIIEVVNDTSDLLALFVPLAEKENNISGSGQFDGCRDRESAISDFANIICADGASRIDAAEHCCSNGSGILTSRIVVSHDNDICALHCGGAHVRSLLSITISPTTEDDDHATRHV